MDVTAENLANAQTTDGAGGQPYRRQEVVLEQDRRQQPLQLRAGQRDGHRRGPEPRPAACRWRGSSTTRRPTSSSTTPVHPGADKQGYVKMPNVNSVTEMTDLIDESDSYQSDVTAMNTAKTMYSSTLSTSSNDPCHLQRGPRPRAPSVADQACRVDQRPCGRRRARPPRRHSGAGSFGSQLSSGAIGVRWIKSQHVGGDRRSQGLATGTISDPTQAVTAVENASLAMDLASQVSRQAHRR